MLVGLTLLSEVVDLVERSVVVDLELEGVPELLSFEVPLCVLVPLLFPVLVFLSIVPLWIVLLSLVDVDLSDTPRDDVPLFIVPFSLLAELARVDPSAFRVAVLVPVIILPSESLLTLRDEVVEIFLFSVLLLLTRVS